MAVQHSADMRHNMRRPCGEPRQKNAPSRSYPASWLIAQSFLCFVFAVAPLPVAAQTTSIIQGMVTDQENLAVGGAVITLSGPMSSTDRPTDDHQRHRIVSNPGIGGWHLQLACG
jgi:hypothetical protein